MTRESRQQRPSDRAPAQFERHLMGAYLAGAGHDLPTLLARSDEHARQLLARASEYAMETSNEVRQVNRWGHVIAPTPHLYE